MKRILIEIDERFVTKWGFIYFGIQPGPDGLQLIVPPEPSCLPGFEYVKHPEANGATFRFTDVDMLEKAQAHAHTHEPVDPVVHAADDLDQARNA